MLCKLVGTVKVLASSTESLHHQPLRKQVLKWEFLQTVVHGIIVQIPYNERFPLALYISLTDTKILQVPVPVVTIGTN